MSKPHPLLVLFVLGMGALAAGPGRTEEPVWLFSYFTGNGESGLHLAQSQDGYTWEALNQGQPLLAPEVGREKLMRDPCIVPGPEGRYHMVWTPSWQETGIGYAWSDDLSNWSEQRLLLVMAHEPEARNCWAPELFYDETKEHWLIIWSTTIPGRFTEGEHTGDDGYNHRMYFTVTKDFVEFSETKLFYDHGFNVIDGTIFREGDQYLLVLKDETRHPPQKNLRIARATAAEGPYGPPSAPITGDYWAEGPTAAKFGEEWRVYFDKYTLNTFGAVATTDLSTWRDISGEIRFPDGARHGTVFRGRSLQ
jgi:hypothetical protein